MTQFRSITGPTKDDLSGSLYKETEKVEDLHESKEPNAGEVRLKTKTTVYRKTETTRTEEENSWDH